MVNGETCSFTFDFGNYEGPSYEWETETDAWECPHGADPGEEYCLFHRPPEETDDHEVVCALIEQIETLDGSDRRASSKQFVGARFGDLDLSFATVDAADNFPLDLRCARIEGDFDCSHAVFYEPVDFRGAVVEGDVSFEDVRFYSDAWFGGATFAGDVNFFDVQFDDDAHMPQIRVDGETVLEDGTYNESLDLSGARLAGDVDAEGAGVCDEVDMTGATFGSTVSFDDVTFENDVYLTGATMEEYVSFEGARFEADLLVRDLDGAGTVLDLTAAELDGGVFAWSVGDRLFDLTDATIGDVTLEPSEGAAFAGLHVEETSFDGFDFGSYVAELADHDFEVHSSDVDRAGSETSDELATIENTYVKAKNGAKASGNDYIAAEFFLQEMRYRGEGHRSRVTDSSLPALRRATAATDYFSNRLLGLATGYGERPSRVVGVAVATIVGFSFVFAAMMDPAPFREPVLGPLVISATSFVTLVLVGSEQITDPTIHLLAEIEGFTGAFLIALFVFTLTRSINR